MVMDMLPVFGPFARTMLLTIGLGVSAVIVRDNDVTARPHPDVTLTPALNPIPTPSLPFTLVSDIHVVPSQLLPMPPLTRSVMSNEPMPLNPTIVMLVDPVDGPFTRTTLLLWMSVKSIVIARVSVSLVCRHNAVTPTFKPRLLPCTVFTIMEDADDHTDR
jgi:hypothetical protein